MSAPAEMAGLLQQWRRMTKAETEAIHAAAWPKLQYIQSNKAQLQTSLNEALAKWRAQQSPEFRTGDVDAPFRAEVTKLIALEAHNVQLLAARRQKARERQQQLERAKRNLRKVHHSYAPQTCGALNSWS